MVKTQYKKVLKDFIVIEASEGGIGKGTNEEIKEFIKSNFDGEEMTAKQKQPYLIEKCSNVKGLFDAL